MQSPSHLRRLWESAAGRPRWAQGAAPHDPQTDPPIFLSNLYCLFFVCFFSFFFCLHFTEFFPGLLPGRARPRGSGRVCSRVVPALRAPAEAAGQGGLPAPPPGLRDCSGREPSADCGTHSWVAVSCLLLKDIPGRRGEHQPRVPAAHGARGRSQALTWETGATSSRSYRNRRVKSLRAQQTCLHSSALQDKG